MGVCVLASLHSSARCSNPHSSLFCSCPKGLIPVDCPSGSPVTWLLVGFNQWEAPEWDQWEGKRPLTSTRLWYCDPSRKNIKLPRPFSTKRKASNHQVWANSVGPREQERTAGERGGQAMILGSEYHPKAITGLLLLGRNRKHPHTRCCAKHFAEIGFHGKEKRDYWETFHSQTLAQNRRLGIRPAKQKNPDQPWQNSKCQVQNQQWPLQPGARIRTESPGEQVHDKSRKLKVKQENEEDLLAPSPHSRKVNTRG